MLRRTETKTHNVGKATFNDGRLAIDFTKRQVFVDGKDAELTRKEYRITSEFVLNAGTLLEYQRASSRCLGRWIQERKKLVQAVVRRLRCKIEADLRILNTSWLLRGVGYRFKEIPKNN